MFVGIKRNLVLLTALIYMIFACSYVLLCRRDTSVVNLVDCFYSFTSKQNVSPVIKSPIPHSPIANKFLSRPRVVFNRPVLLSFVLTAVTILSFFVFSFLNYTALIIVSTSHFKCPGIVFLRSWRI